MTPEARIQYQLAAARYAHRARKAYARNDFQGAIHWQGMAADAALQASDRSSQFDLERAAEKQRSRDADAQALASGTKTAEQLRIENSHFRDIAKEPIDWSKVLK